MAAHGIFPVVKQRINSLCDERNMSHYDLALQSGIPYTTIKNLFSGRTQKISIQTIKMVADAFEMDIVTFFDTPDFRGLEQELK